MICQIHHVICSSCRLATPESEAIEIDAIAGIVACEKCWRAVHEADRLRLLLDAVTLRATRAAADNAMGTIDQALEIAADLLKNPTGGSDG